MKHISRQLIEKSQEAIILSLELYNKPTIQYRIEGFCFFFSNAWELLLKAKIIEDEKNESSIYYRKVKGQVRRSLSLRDCIKKVFPNEKDPIRKNIEEIAELRDCSTHYIIEELESIFSGLFQAGILNYVSKISEWFDKNISDKCSPALMTLVSDFKDIDPIKLKKKYGTTIVEFVKHQITKINNIEEQVGDSKFRIPIEYKLVLTKKEADADIRLTASSTGASPTLIVEVPKDPNLTHPHLQKNIIDALKKIYPNFNQYDFQAVVKKERIKGNHIYHYQHKDPVIHKYSPSLIDLIKNKIEIQPEYLKNARSSFTRAKPNRKRKKNGS